ncbi:MAG: orotidine 5'-phosphate decarboxylase / HUMPS family protein [Nanoarchaeota archaeon]|nr:orotidine 5'-phosphate decarboxylase / HUMPS family protein [Nanoarchaeota archaeon]
MNDYKGGFINFLLETGALKIFDNPSDDKTLKSKRISSWFVNIGDFNDGKSSNALAEFYAEAIISSGVETDVLYGIPDKGVGLVAPIAIAMAARRRNVGWFFSRKDEKTHGEATNLGPEDRIKKLTVGRVPKVDDKIIQLDDVFTAGDAKYEANTFLKSLGRSNLPLLAIAVDRQEVGIDGKSAIEEYESKTGTKVISVVSASDIYHFLKNQVLIPTEGLERMANYLRVYGTGAARKTVGKLEQKIIERDRSVIPACDVETLEQFESLVQQTGDLEGIGAYKLGFELGLGYGLPKVVETARKHTDKPLIYDHQKAGTDIPDTGKNFAKRMKKSGIDTVILFPQAGPETERAWIYHALDQGLKVIIGGRMTHPGYTVSEGGFITDEGALEMYRIAARIGINDYVVPGNKPETIKQIKEVVEAEGSTPVFYAPGFVEQGGIISNTAKVAGDRFHGIVGRGIYAAKDMRTAAIEQTSQL